MQHQFVAFQYTPVEFEVRDNGDIDTFVTEAAEEIAKDDSHIACYHCLTPLNTNTHDAECQGSPVQALQS